MRLAVAGQGDEADVILACLLDVAAADDAHGIREQHYLQQLCGRIGGGTGCVVAKARIEAGQVQHFVEQVVQCVFEGAG